MMKPEKPRTVIILACHRSGTKMVGNCLYDCGILFGYVNLTGERNLYSVPRFARWVRDNATFNRANPILFTTHTVPGVCSKKLVDYLNDPDDLYSFKTLEDTGDHRLTYINDIIMLSSGHSTWDKPKVADINDIYMGSLGKALIQEYNAVSDFWGFKDPRMVFTFDFWERAFKDFNNELKLVFIYRNPMSVAQGSRHDITGTNETHPDWPVERGLQMWKDYNIQMLELMDLPYDKIVLRYEDFFEGDSEVKLLDKFLGLGGKLRNPANPAKRHQNSQEIPQDCKSILLQLEVKRTEINSRILNPLKTSTRENRYAIR